MHCGAEDANSDTCAVIQTPVHERIPTDHFDHRRRDLMLSNTVRVPRKLRRAGVEPTLQVYEGMSHAQYEFDDTLRESKEAFGEIASFFGAHLGK